MDIVYLLVPLSAILVLAIVIVLWWAINNDQFEDLEAMGASILEDDAPLQESKSTTKSATKIENLDPNQYCGQSGR